MRQKISIELFTYWSRIRSFSDAPLRSQVDPAAIAAILPHVFILQPGSGGDIRFRLAGTLVCSAFGRELRGTSFASLWAAKSPIDPLKIAEGVMSHATPALLNATAFSLGERTANFEIVLLPMRSSPEACDRLIGCLAPVGNLSWLGVDPITGLAMDRSRLLHDWPTPDDIAALETRAAKSIIVAKGTELGQTLRRVLNLKVFEGGGA
jgi:hypothetical protein